MVSKLRFVLFSMLVSSFASYSLSLEKVYFYWGWNRSAYTKSKIFLDGEDYNFRLEGVKANDRPSTFGIDPYFTLNRFTIPQYNFRLGFFINESTEITFGFDHMKYVVEQGQTAKITGSIYANSVYDGSYQNQDVLITDEFFFYEHTDGLNIASVGARRSKEILKRRLGGISILYGGEVGVCIPKTFSQVLGNRWHDQFFVSGWSASGVVGARFTIFNSFFMQSELKTGFVGLPEVRISKLETEKAKQNFGYGQLNIVFGVLFNTKKESRTIDSEPKEQFL